MAVSLKQEIEEACAKETVARINAEIAQAKIKYAEALSAEIARLKKLRQSAANYIDWVNRRRAQMRYHAKKRNAL